MAEAPRRARERRQVAGGDGCGGAGTCPQVRDRRSLAGMGRCVREGARVKIRMLIKISGGRGDGTEWPDPGTDFYVDDAEGAHLCAARLAVPVAEEPYTEIRSEPDLALVPTAAGKPIVNAPKAAWVDHAVTRGVDRGEAQAMSKADLIARFGRDQGSPEG